jgi:hypothetical protein
MKNIPNIYKHDRAFYELHTIENFTNKYFKEWSGAIEFVEETLRLSFVAYSSARKRSSRIAKVLFYHSRMGFDQRRLLYAQRLRKAGVEVEIAFYENAFHSMVPMIENLLGFQKARDFQADTIKNRYFFIFFYIFLIIIIINFVSMVLWFYSI